MTWGEFKAWMEEHGVKDSDCINWIDVTDETSHFPPEIDVDADGNRFISVGSEDATT